jgi:hypothetical protein
MHWRKINRTQKGRKYPTHSWFSFDAISALRIQTFSFIRRSFDFVPSCTGKSATGTNAAKNFALGYPRIDDLILLLIQVSPVS